VARGSRSRRSRTSEAAETVVRDAAPEDADAISDVRIRSWQAGYAHVFPPERLESLTARREEQARRWRSLIESPPLPGYMLLAEREGEAIGFSSIGQARDDDSAGEVYAIYVVPEEWGAGAGHALMQESLRRLREDGYREGILWVLDDNPRARTFYEREGWILTDVRREETFLETPVAEVRYRIPL
jgi:GNAT superfamily N-acetyltransferase